MFPILIKRTVRVSPRRLRTVISQGQKQAHQNMGTWLLVIATPRRFTREHAREANYTPRKRRYEIAKQKKFGHRNPLQFTGRAKLASTMARITATSTKTSVRFPQLRVLNLKLRNSSINMRQEFEFVTQKETGELAAVYENTLNMALQNVGVDPEITFAN